MKKIILAGVLLFSLQNYAQKVFYIYNFSGETVKIADLMTKPNNGASFPEFHSKPSGLISIAPGDMFTLENSSNDFRFPFLSTADNIPSWERLSSPATSTLFTNNMAWPLGNAQVFSRLQLYVGSDYELTPDFSSFNTNTSVSNVFSGLGYSWQLDYEFFISGNTQIYTIMIF